MKYFSEDHEWIDVAGDIGTVGVTNHAVEQLGDVVFVELPEVGQEVDQNGDVAVVESVKAASDIYSPVAGEVTEANDDLSDNPGALNDDPEGSAWIYKIRISDASELESLMDEAGYKKFIGA